MATPLFATKNEKVDDAFIFIEQSLSYRLGAGKDQLALRGSREIAFYDKKSSEGLHWP